MNKIILAMLMLTLVMASTTSRRSLCSTCEYVFGYIRDHCVDIANITEKILEEKIEAACEQVVDKSICQYVEQIAKKEIEHLFDIIVNQEKAIVPETLCKHLRLCQ
ncbi:unnamed protein product [Bursaphelenchus okinawaensis]|uniref:Saposin B-type domain-containing protein n=1 Tax=Bursaphelenchus okinawaensis TaxID=465554 RepID=A0A811LSX7_9BILA|nr:unnamed protein product [Bursaphelenchus okinawaensis]CAG9127958.1 unnamed protein product [Bursaphelenchus okinawaensis]